MNLPLLNWLPAQWKERLRRRAGVVTLQGRLENLRRAGFAPRQIIDAGAYRGEWARTALAIFPAARALMIEAQPALAAPLVRLCAQDSRLHFRSALLGARPSRAKFLLSGTNSRVVPDAYVPAPGEDVRELAIETLADLAQAAGFVSCDLLKLDLQGHELSSLAGAGEMFGQVEVILTEVSWLPIGNPPLIGEICAAFHERGYRLYDVLGFNYRPFDGALWQSDLIFVRRGSPLLAEEGRWA